jgi:hypothetical protein
MAGAHSEATITTYIVPDRCGFWHLATPVASAHALLTGDIDVALHFHIAVIR